MDRARRIFFKEIVPGADRAMELARKRLAGEQIPRDELNDLDARVDEQAGVLFADLDRLEKLIDKDIE